MEIVAFWLIFSVVAGIIASSRGRSGFGYFFLSIVLSPLIGLVLAVALPSLKANPTINGGAASSTPTEVTHVRCHACAEWVLPEAKVCKHCGAALTPDEGFHQRKAAELTQAKKDDNKNLLIGIGAVGGLIAFVATIGNCAG